MIDSARKFIVSASKVEHCSDCNKEEFTALNILINCDSCSKRFCKKCISKSNLVIPPSQLRGSQRESSTHMLCHSSCKMMAINYWMEIRKDELKEKYDHYINNYLLDEKYKVFFDKPNSLEDTSYRKALRMARIAEVAASVAGLSYTFTAVKYLYYGSEIVNQIIAGDLLNALGPVMDSLKAFDIKGSTGVLNLYYLGCKHVMDLKIYPTLEYSGYDLLDDGVIRATCPPDLLHYAGKYFSCSQWLYASLLPSPHDDTEWSAWYLTRLVSRQGWTVIACVNETTKLLDGSKCPAFALLVRCKRKNKKEFHSVDLSSDPLLDYLDDGIFHTDIEREAVLAIRGTSSTMDWSINLDEKAKPFTFYTKRRENHNPYAVYSDDLTALGLQGITGHVHSGMYGGAVAILESFAMRKYLSLLSINGYSVKIVGHSLGAGTAALIAAELRNGYLLSSNEILRSAKIRALTIATPACTSASISDAFAYDRLVLNVIKWSDAVPRFTRSNISKLAAEIVEYKAISEQWRSEDTDALKAYAASYGKAGDMTDKDNVINTETQSKSTEMSTFSSNVEIDSNQISSLITVAANLLDSSASSSGDLSNTTIVGTVTDSSSTSSTNNSASSWYSKAFQTSNLVSVVSAASTAIAITSNTRTNSSTSSDVVITNASITKNNSSSNAIQATVSSKRSFDKIKEAPPSDYLMKEDDIPLVVPGHIIQLYNENGVVKAAVIDHRHASLNRLYVLIDRFLDDHLMKGYLSSMRSLRQQHKYYNRERYQSINLNESNEDINSEYKNSWQSLSSDREFVMNYSSTANFNNNIIDKSMIKKLSTTTWQNCNVCSMDCNWAYILRSSANRALVSQHCTLCGVIVCCICSPAGDSIPGDGFNTTIKLPDWRISVPSQGILEPKRVCVHCYLDSYDII